MRDDNMRKSIEEIRKPMKDENIDALILLFRRILFLDHVYI